MSILLVMPSAYQIFKKEQTDSIRNEYFSDYELKQGETFNSLVSAKCKELWGELSDDLKNVYCVLSNSPDKIKMESNITWTDGYIKGYSDAGIKHFDTFEAAYAYHILNNTSATGITRYLSKTNLVYDLRGGKKGQNSSITIINDDLKEQVSYLFPKTDTIDVPPSYDESLKEVIDDEIEVDMSVISDMSDMPVISDMSDMSDMSARSAMSDMSDMSDTTKKRKKIPKAIRTNVWKKYISPELMKGQCFVGCGTQIEITNFEVGHVVAFARGGTDTIDNLRPICSLCNKSMGTTNLNEFMEKFKSNSVLTIDLHLNETSASIKKLEKTLTKFTQKQTLLTTTHEVLTTELNSLELQAAELQIKIGLKRNESDKTLNSIKKLDDSILKTEEEIQSLKLKHNQLNETKEQEIKNIKLEEERIKDEIRQEILLNKKKELLRLQVMSEMGLAN